MERAKRGAAAVRLLDVEAGALEELPQQQPDVGVVVDDQDPNRVAHTVVIPVSGA